MTTRVVFFDASSDPQPWLAVLRRHLPAARVEVWVDGAEPADYAVVWAPPQALIDQQTRLKALFNVGAGVDRLVQLRLPGHLPVVRLDDAGMGVQMSEYVCHAVIRHFRAFAGYQAQAAEGVWLRRPAVRRSDFTVGVMGLGVLGSQVTQALRQFDFPVHGWSRSARAVDGVRCFAGAAQLADFLAQCRALVCLLPLTADTRDILGHAALSQLPGGAYLVNVARGELVVDDDLLALLDAGQLAGATLDVFRTEPLPPQHAFWRHPKITVTPHISAQTLCEESMAQIAGKIQALERGETVAGRVDLQRGY